MDSIKKRTYDTIVIGSGMSGGWAAKEFTEKKLKTLVLERGREVKHIVDYPTTMKEPWEFDHRGQMPLDVQKANPIASKCYIFREDAAHFVVKDAEHPYVQEKPFDWIRGYQTGGKSLLWARQTQRWSEYDFEGPARDGFAVSGPSAIMILRLGTVMSSALQVFRAIKTAWQLCPTVNFYRRMK